MDFLFKGVLPAELPPVPSIELRQGHRPGMDKMIAREVCTPAHA